MGALRYVASGAVGAALCLAAGDAHAFKPEGHLVVEAMAYRELGTGPDGEVLASLIRDGALEAPVCFWNRSNDCIDRYESDPLAWWPAPHTDAADMVLARQFSHSGQCFHFMAEQDDEGGPHWVDPANPDDPHVSYGLMWDAYLRCTSQLEWIAWRVIVNPVDAREKAHGLYELLHAVADSYSRAHTERQYDGWHPGGADPPIEYLKVWQPTVGNPFSDTSLNSRHMLSDERDENYVDRNRVEDGRQCSSYAAHPYSVPPACLSQEGRLAVDALEDVMRLVARMRKERATRAQLHAAWMEFVARHMPHAATKPRDPARPAPAYEHEDVPFAFFGVRGQSNPEDSIFDSTFFARYVVTSGAIDPLTLAVQAEVGTRHDFAHHTESVLLRQDIDAMLSLGNDFSVGFTPFSIDWAGGHGQPDRVETLTRALHVDWIEPLRLSRVALSIWGPGEYSWLDERLRWSAGIALSGGLLEHAPGVVHRSYDPARHSHDGSDVAWVPPLPWDSELRKADGPTLVGAYVGATTGSGTGEVREGLEVDFLKRNWWGDLNPASFGVLLEDTLEFTNDSAPHTSLAALLTGRLYLLPPIGLIADVGGSSPDLSAAHLHPWAVVSRFGLVMTVGRVDIVVESPTLPRTDWTDGEILTARLGLEGLSL